MIRIIVGVILALVLPGYTATLVMFKKQDLIERLIFSIGLSIVFVTMVAFVLGGNSAFRELTGGYTFDNIFIFLGVISLINYTIYLGLKWRES